MSGRIVVVSPHLDDAVFSVGGVMSALVRRGHRVTVLSVFAGDPENGGPPSAWDRRSGFLSAGDAVRGRREEDRQALSRLGATPMWLPFDDDGYPSARPVESIWDAIRDVAEDATAVLAPGWPLRHADHRWVARLVTRRYDGSYPLGLFVEQPYAVMIRELVRSRFRIGTLDNLDLQKPGYVRWQSIRVERIDRTAKREAIGRYQTQVRAMGKHMPVFEWYQWLSGRERIGWVHAQNERPEASPLDGLLGV